MVRRTRKAVQWGPMGGGGYLHCTPHPLDPVHDFILQVRRKQPPVTVVSSTSGLPNAMPRCRNTTVSVGFSKLCCRTGGGRGGGGVPSGRDGIEQTRGRRVYRLRGQSAGQLAGRAGQPAGRPTICFIPATPHQQAPSPVNLPPFQGIPALYPLYPLYHSSPNHANNGAKGCPVRPCGPGSLLVRGCPPVGGPPKCPKDWTSEVTRQFGRLFFFHNVLRQTDQRVVAPGPPPKPSFARCPVAPSLNPRFVRKLPPHWGGGCHNGRESTSVGTLDVGRGGAILAS